MHRLALTVVLLLGPLALNASAVIIDDFSDSGFGGNKILLTNDGTPSLPNTVSLAQGPGLGGARGGYRTEILTVTKDTVPGLFLAKFAIIVTASPSYASTSNDDNVNSKLILEYGFYAGHPFSTVLDLSKEVGMAVAVLTADNSGHVVIDLHSGGTDYVSKQEDINKGPGFYLIPFLDFLAMPPSALTSIDGVEYTFTGGDSWDMSFRFLGTSSDIPAIPEPATMTLLGLGVLAVIRHRRRKS